MITYIDGDLFRSEAKVMVCPVNPVGIMDHGIALEFKKRGPKMFKAYKDLCELGQVKVGNLFVFKTRSRWVIHFPTRENTDSPSSLEIIEAGLVRFLDVHQELDLGTVAFPHLGCGTGGLHWAEVKPLMEKHLGSLRLEIEIFNYVPERPGGPLQPRFGNGDCLIFA